MTISLSFSPLVILFQHVRPLISITIPGRGNDDKRVGTSHAVKSPVLGGSNTF